MPLTHSEIDRLRFEGEGPSLDFKREQYPLAGATEELKSELLKDVLAFANSWRDRDAFILIGVDATGGSPAVVTGISDHIDDAALQQFVNSKANRPITLSYEIAHYDSRQVGVIRIPVQDRPFYAERKFGKVKEGVVYIRRGSSTTVASPEEIARMGELKHLGGLETPQFQVRLGDPSSGQEIQDHEEIMWNPVRPLTSANLNRLIKVDSERREATAEGFYGSTLSSRSYCRELVDYIVRKSELLTFNIVVTNHSKQLASNVRVELGITAPTRIDVVEIDDEPVMPTRVREVSTAISRFRSALSRERTVDVLRRGAGTRIEAEMRNIQPRVTVRTDEYFLLGGEGAILFEGIVSCDQGPPQDVRFELKLTPGPREMTLEDVYHADSSLK